MKRWFLTLVACLISSLVAAQVPVPYTFVPGTPASATQVNANFTALSDGALNVSGGVLTGNMTVNPGVTVDGIDISEVFGGTGSKILTVDGAKLVSKSAPQFTIGFDPTHTVTWAVDINGNSVLDSLAPGSGFTFSDPVAIGVLTANTITAVNFGCTGCIAAAQIADGTVGAAEITDGSVGTAEIADGSVSGADITDGTIAAIDIQDGVIASIDILDGSVSGIDITDGTITGVDLNDILGAVKAGVYGDALTVARVNVDTDGRIIDIVPVTIAFPAPPASYALGANQIPENAINNDAGTLILRPGDTASIPGEWTFTGTAPHSTNGFSVPAGNLDSGLKFTGTTLSIIAIAPGIYLRGGPTSTIGYFDMSVWSPLRDNAVTLGQNTSRFSNLNLALQPNDAPSFVIVNKGGGGADANSALGYVIGAVGADIEATRNFGGCVVKIKAGLITATTGTC